ncbi:epsin [Galdieria sulphuraria]|uniref:Epsin n=1 Tax=Galdieria sulphuraria TaxID=130081 RepID=M2XXU9_GALSU|nr:epsin [Galdieria sulphuraria]EME28264.1 epsin [Galdieria sulphuraria]|eukprot:XP_005704784.1 epsin [Galdieria sulphuraria]
MDTVRQLKHRIKNIKWKNVKRTASIAKGKAVSKVKDFYMTDFENRVRKATSNRNWSVGSVELAEIAQYSYNPLLYKIMMDIVYSRLKDKGHNWRRVYKALELIRYLILHGAPGVLLDMQHSVHTFEALENFRYVHPKTGKDVGHNVRLKAKQLVDLIRDRRLLEKEREQSRAMLDKISQSKRVAYSSTTAYLDKSKAKVEDTPGERISQRRIVVDKDYSIHSNDDIGSASSNYRGSIGSENKRMTVQATCHDSHLSTNKQHPTQEHLENDLLLLDDLSQDDEASVSEESIHDVESDKDFGEFVESLSDMKLEESSRKSADDFLTDLKLPEGAPDWQRSTCENSNDQFVSKVKANTSTRENLQKTMSEDNVITTKIEDDVSNEMNRNSKLVAKSPPNDSISSGKGTKKKASDSQITTLDSRQVRGITSQEDNQDDPFGQLVSEWINASHPSHR